MNVAFIPLRGGSKSIPLKNIKNFVDEPLCYWVIRELELCHDIHKIVVATDSEKIKDCVVSFNFSKLIVYDRDEENAKDTSTTESVMLEYIYKSNFEQTDNFFLVQATNPFVQSIHFTKALLMLDAGFDSVLSCVPFKRFLWDKKGTPKNYDLNKRPRRQDFEGELMENGAFYLSTINKILKSENRISGKIGIFKMEEYSAYEIDEPDDWIIMENLFKKNILKDTSIFENKNYGKSIRLFLSDVDGVLTDAGMYYSESGDELKKFNTHDGMAFKLLKEAGIKTGFITSEITEIVKRRAEKLKVDYLYQGTGFDGKLNAAIEICKLENIELKDIAYIGDDINCIPLLKNAGIAACPANAVDAVKSIFPDIIHLKKRGGEGAVREFVQILLKHLLI